MVNGEEEKWEQFRDLTEIMEKTPRQEPPDGFTAIVMARLPEGKGAVRGFSFWRPSWNQAPTAYLSSLFRLPATKTECAFSFFLAGVFYLVLAFVLFLGMRNLSGDIAGSSWLRVQPFIGFFLALWFFAFSILLRGRWSASLTAARIAVFIYLEIILINGMLPLIKFGSQWYLLPFWGLTAGCMIIGGYLAVALQSNLKGGSIIMATAKRWGT